MKLPNFLCPKRRCELIRLGQKNDNKFPVIGLDQPNNKNKKDEPIVFE